MRAARVDADPGDYDPTEVQRGAMGPEWHPSHLMQHPKELQCVRSDAGRRALDHARALLAEKASSQAQNARHPVAVASWSAMPELYRRMVAAAAGLPREVVGKRDRELSEREKVMIRSAASDMREWLRMTASL